MASATAEACDTTLGATSTAAALKQNAAACHRLIGVWSRRAAASDDAVVGFGAPNLSQARKIRNWDR